MDVTLKSSSLDMGLWIAASAIWGSAFLFLEFALKNIPPLSITAFRLLLGGGALVIWTSVSVYRGDIPSKAVTDVCNHSDVGKLVVLALLNGVFPIALVSYGERWTGSAVASIIGSCTPVLYQVVRTITKEPIDIPFCQMAVGIITALSGVVLITAQDLKNNTSRSRAFTALGNICLFGSSLMYALGAFVSRKYCRHINPTITATAQNSIGAVIAIIVFLPIDATMPPSGYAHNLRFLSTASLLSWIGIVYQGVLSAFIGFLIYFRLLGTLGPTKVTAAWMTFPLYGVIESVLFLNSWDGETIRYKAVQCIGCLFAIGGLFIVLGGVQYFQEIFYSWREGSADLRLKLSDTNNSSLVGGVHVDNGNQRISLTLTEHTSNTTNRGSKNGIHNNPTAEV